MTHPETVKTETSYAWITGGIENISHSRLIGTGGYGAVHEVLTINVNC